MLLISYFKVDSAPSSATRTADVKKLLIAALGNTCRNLTGFTETLTFLHWFENHWFKYLHSLTFVVLSEMIQPLNWWWKSTMHCWDLWGVCVGSDSLWDHTVTHNTPLCVALYTLSLQKHKSVHPSVLFLFHLGTSYSHFFVHAADITHKESEVLEAHTLPLLCLTYLQILDFIFLSKTC